MILVWKDVTSFCRHLHEMRVFWQLHESNFKHRQNNVRDMPAVRDVRPQSKAGGTNRLYNNNGQLIAVPIWKITPPKGTQN